MPEVEFETGSKRSTDYEYGNVDDYKKSRVGDIKMRLLLVGRQCGSVIGKKGENLTRLRTQHNVQIDMPSSRTIDRIFNIDGSIDACVNVAKEILPGCSQAPYPVGQKCAFELNLLANADAVGMVIGKGGDKIKQIRDESETKLKVYQECLPNSNERVIAIGGDTEDQVIKALALILNVLNNTSRSHHTIFYDPSNKPSEIMGGGGMGGGGMGGMTGSGNMPPASMAGNMGMQQNTMAGNMGMQQNTMAGNMGMQQNTMAGNMGMQQNTMAGNMGMQQNTWGAGNMPPASMAGNTGMQQNTWGADRPDTDSEFLELSTEKTITVPNDMCGAIIGKAGVRIREIRATSRAKIATTISDKETVQDRVITITGTQQQVHLAEQLMSQCVRNRNK